MSDKAQDLTAQDIAVRDPELERFRQLGRWLELAERDDKTPASKGAANALRYYYAEALGLPPMAAAELYVVDGKLHVSALLLRALAEERGFRVERDDDLTNDTQVTAVIYRGANELGRSTFTLDDAKRAGLAGKRNWQTYPQRMLWARAATNVIRDYAPIVTVGIVTNEELETPTNVLPGEPTGMAAVIAEDADWAPAGQTDLYDAEQETTREQEADLGETPEDTDGEPDA